MNKIKYVYDSLKWIKRKKNKDDILIIENEHILLCILFDWVSSSYNAKKWINFIKKFIVKNINKYIFERELNLKKIIYDSNEYLLSKGLEDSFTTCSAFVLSYFNNSYKILNIWDSRIYWIFNQYKIQFTNDDNDLFNKNLLTNFLWKRIEYNEIKEAKLDYENLKEWNILICSDWFYNIFEDNKLLFHKILHYKKLWNIKRKLFKEVKNKNNDDSSYIYILINKNV